jgi:transposase
LEDRISANAPLLSRRWVVERSFTWTSRFKRLARDYERLPETLKGIYLAAFDILMLQQWLRFPVDKGH